MLARYELHPVVADAAVPVGDYVAEFYERVTPIDGIERQLHQLSEPCLVEIVCRVLHLLAVRADNLERARHDEALALLDTAGQVQVSVHVPVDVVKRLAVWAVHVDGQLPGVAPVLYVLPRQRVGRALQVDYHLPHFPAVAFLCEIEVSVSRMQHPVVMAGEILPYVFPYSHKPTSYSVVSSGTRK